MVEQELRFSPGSRGLPIKWVLGEGTYGPSMRGEWRLSVRRVRRFRWTWSVSFSGGFASASGAASSAQLAMLQAEEAAATAEERNRAGELARYRGEGA